MNPFIKKKEEKIDLKKTIEGRIKDYALAIDYFKKNEYNNEQIKKGEDDKKILIEILDKIKSGETIDEKEEKLIPKAITPEYINGYSNDERTKKYYEIILKIIEEKKKLKVELENEIKELKKLKENQILSMERDIINDFEKIKQKKEKYDEIINILKDDFQNKWIPAPLYLEKEEDIKVEVIKEEIPENTIRIEFKKTDYVKNKKIFITAELKGTEHKEEWEQKAAGDWSHLIEWQLNEEEYKKISKKLLYFQINERVKANKNKFKGYGEIRLSRLEDNNELTNRFPFILQTKRMNPRIEIIFQIRKCIKPKIQSTKKRIFCFTKFYPPFKEE